VKYAYEEDNPDWDNLKPVFRGTIQELYPSMDKTGEVVSVVAYGQAYPLKLMRAKSEYGSQSVSNPDISTMKAIIQDIIDKYVNHVLGSSTASGWNINTDYVYDLLFWILQGGIPVSVPYIPYLNLPYTDAFQSLQEILKLTTSAIYVDAITNHNAGWVGVHWIVDVDGYLCVAPIGGHDVYADPTHRISDKWPTFPLLSPLVVKQDMISEQFKKRAFNANYVIVAGKYVYPLNESWTEGHASDWKGYDGGHNAWQYDPTNVYGFDDTDQLMGLPGDVYSLKIETRSGNESCLLHPFTVDLTALSSRGNVPKIGFWISKGAGVSSDSLEARFCKSKLVNEIVVPDLENCFTAKISIGVANNYWQWVEFPIGFYAQGWTIIGSLQWSDVAYFGIRYIPETGQSTNVWLDYLEVSGSVLRFAKDSVHMTQYGCKMLMLKDTLAKTSTLDPNDTDNPLAQLCIYELSRQRVDIVTGSVVIPMNSVLMAGQTVALITDFEPYTVDYRITQVRHSFSKAGAVTELTVTDDVFNSVSIALQSDAYGQILKALDPNNYANKTWASLFTATEITCDLATIGIDLPAPVLMIGYAQNGFTSPVYGKHRKIIGSSADVEALPNSGFVLNFWMLDGVNAGSSNPISVTMDKSHTITPLFKVAGT
jgi:hypothetical protein